MQVSVESGEGLEMRLLVDVPAEKVNEATDKKLAELSQHVRLDGFRPGKVPMRVVKQRFGDAVKQDVYGELIQATFYEAATEQKLVPVGDPKIDLRDAAEEGGLSYTASFETMPKVELADMSDKEVTKPMAEVTDADLEEMLDKLRSQRTEWSEVDRAAQDGDTLTIDFKGMIDGEVFEGGSADNVPLVLGSNSMIEGFESGLLGASAGDERTLELSFPEDYRAEHLAGKQTTFEVKVQKVAEPKMPELDEEFVKAYGIEDGTVESLREEVGNNMKNELEQKLSGMVKDAAMTALREANPLDIPAAMVTQEAESMKKQAMADMQARGQQANMDLPASLFEEQAKTRVHLGMLVGEIIDSQEFTAEEDAVRDTIAKFAQSYEDPSDVIEYYMTNPEQRRTVENLVLENKVVDWVLEQVKVTEEQRSFSEVMNPGE